MIEVKPLTLEELRCMANKPYWHVGLRGAPHWCILDPLLANHPEDYDYGETWLAYAHEPSHLNRSEWESCEYCNGKKTLFQHTNSTKLFVDTFGSATTLVTECVCCPPYAKCGMKDIPANSVFKINFCPHCGRPLTEAAWEMLEKRLDGAE